MVRRTRIVFDAPPTRIVQRTAEFELAIEPGRSETLFISTFCEIEGAEPAIPPGQSETYLAGLEKIRNRPFTERATLLFTRLLFRGIYFPQMHKGYWIRTILANRSSLLRIVREGVAIRYRRGVVPATPAKHGIAG